MAQRMVIPPTAFAATSGRQKRNKIESKVHLAAIRDLPCCICLSMSGIEAAHVRSSSAQFAKPETGMGTRPSDAWTLPLCAHHHRLAPDSQHNVGEDKFWSRYGINPFVLALALWEATGDEYRMAMIVERARDA